MRMVVYGTECDTAELPRLLETVTDLKYRRTDVVGCTDYDGFIAALSGAVPDCIVIAMNGADGMEGVIAARNICGGVPVMWFSDDDGFGVQSYRLGCAYFHKKPVSPQIISAAIARCV